MSVKKKMGNLYFNWKSAKTNAKILVIESDDWGSLRTETLAQRDSLNNIDPSVQKDPYIQLDGLADEDDLSALFEMLGSVKNNNGKYPVLTANVCTANPDFYKIKEEHYENFHFESFFKTIEKKNSGKSVLKLWNEGQSNGIFHPQLHGREHLHALSWLAELRNRNKELLKAFELEAWGIPYEATIEHRRKNLQAALDIYRLPNEVEFQTEWLKDSAKIFGDFFGFKSKTFISPAYIWNSDLHADLKQLGITALQGIKVQRQPKKKGYRNKIRFIGEKDKMTGIQFFPRNVFFEPSLFPNKDWHSETLSGIEKAFANKQPAIIGSHRINFIGKLEESNRTRNLKSLKAILQEVVKRHPDVLFVSSDKLIDFL